MTPPNLSNTSITIELKEQLKQDINKLKDQDRIKKLEKGRHKKFKNHFVIKVKMINQSNWHWIQRI